MDPLTSPAPLAPILGHVMSLFFLGFLLLAYYEKKGNKKRENLPPGPGFALPVFGNLLQLGTKPHLTFLKWKEQYGPLIYLKMGNEPAVLLNDTKLMKKLLSSNATTGRPHSAVFNVMSSGGHGVLGSDGKNWEEQRYYVIRALRELGVGSLENIIVDEAKSLLKYFEKRAGLPVQAKRLFNPAVVSSLWTIMSGQQFEWCKDGGDLVECQVFKLSFDILGSINLAAKNGLVFMSWLRHVAPERLGWNRLIKSMGKYLEFMEDAVEEHVATFDANHPRDLIDHFLIRIEEAADEPTSTFYKETGRSNLRSLLTDFFLAGNETTFSGTALEFSMLLLTQHPDVQQRVQHEIDEVVGPSRFPSLEDRSSLPYTQAVLMEILRLSGVASMSPHRFVEDCTFNGYHFKKDMLLLLDFYTALHDPQVWGKDSFSFRPERFLNEDETAIMYSRDGYLPFGIGKRNCVGENLAKDTLFLFLTCIFQKFTVALYPPGRAVDYNDIVPGFTMEPPPFEIIVNQRKP